MQGNDAVNWVAKEEDEFPCYCDENCLNMGDCCQDYKAFCEGDHQFGFKWPFKNCSGIPWWDNFDNRIGRQTKQNTIWARLQKNKMQAWN